MAEQAAQLNHIESTRQAAAVERSATAKKYQVRLLRVVSTLLSDLHLTACRHGQEGEQGSVVRSDPQLTSIHLLMMQAGLKDMHNKHEQESKSLKRQLRSTRAEVVHLTDEVSGLLVCLLCRECSFRLYLTARVALSLKVHRTLKHEACVLTVHIFPQRTRS